MRKKVVFKYELFIQQAFNYHLVLKKLIYMPSNYCYTKMVYKIVGAFYS